MQLKEKERRGSCSQETSNSHPSLTESKIVEVLSAVNQALTSCQVLCQPVHTDLLTESSHVPQEKDTVTIPISETGTPRLRETI